MGGWWVGADYSSSGGFANEKGHGLELMFWGQGQFDEQLLCGEDEFIGEGTYKFQAF